MTNDLKAIAPASACRLCDAEVNFAFRKLFLSKYSVALYECQACGSLQTESPYWLEEAYSGAFSSFDSGICERGIQLSIECTGFLNLLSINKQLSCLDFGGGNGLFATSMRSAGYRFFYYDRFETPYYGKPWALPAMPREYVPIVTAFEVFEHFPNPKEDIADIFSCSPELLIFTTSTYRRQNDDWPYIAAECGQHIFFYSDTALALLAKQHDALYIDFGRLKAFVRQPLIDMLKSLSPNFDSRCRFIRDREKFLGYSYELFTRRQIENTAG